jgi:transcriptional regulator with XRE-family HTH domain
MGGRRESEPVSDIISGRALRARRHELGLTQARVAENARISKSFLSRMELGQVKRPSSSVIEGLSEALNFQAQDLFRAEGTVLLTVEELQEAIREVVREELERFKAKVYSIPTNTPINSIRDRIPENFKTNLFPNLKKF